MNIAENSLRIRISHFVQIEILGCSTDPCVNGACTNLAGGNYLCDCQAGWMDTNCNVGKYPPLNHNASPK